MSLTSHLSESSSPVRGWFAASLGNTRGVVGYANEVLCGKPRVDCVLPPPPDCDRSLSGTAIDYLARVMLRADALELTVATEGAVGLGEHATDLERKAVSRIEALMRSRATPGDDEVIELCRMCLLLSRFEQFFRAGPSVWEHVGAPLEDRPGLDLYAERVVPQPCLTDLVAIAPAIAADHEDLRVAKALTLNPTFDLSVALGGADADLIADETLWDMKSSASRDRIIKREEVWQLAGYSLADVSDTYAIKAVGILAIRRRTRVRWTLAQLLKTLSRIERPIEEWRADFASVVGTDPA
jgi:hypothetical protein